MPRRSSHDSCAYCGRNLIPRSHWLSPTNDHVVPRFLGGDKKVRSCRACNELKGNMDPAVWREFRTTYPRYYLLVHHTGYRGNDILRRLSPEMLEGLLK